MRKGIGKKIEKDEEKKRGKLREEDRKETKP